MAQSDYEAVSPCGQYRLAPLKAEDYYPALRGLPGGCWWRSPKCNASGGPWTPDEIKRRVKWAESDWHAVQLGEMPHGVYFALWVEPDHSGRGHPCPRIAGFSGLHRKHEGDLFVYRARLADSVPSKVREWVIRQTIQLFADVNARCGAGQKAVCTNSASTELYVAAGFTKMADTQIQRPNSDHTRPMALLSCTLPPARIPCIEPASAWREARPKSRGE